MTKPVPRHVTLLAGVLMALLAAAPAGAQDYPNRPVHILVGFNPGAAADLTGRIVASRLGQVFGQQFIVENKPGDDRSDRGRPSTVVGARLARPSFGA